MALFLALILGTCSVVELVVAAKLALRVVSSNQRSAPLLLGALSVGGISIRLRVSALAGCFV